MADKYKSAPSLTSDKDKKKAEKFHLLEGLDNASKKSSFFKNPMQALRFFFFAFANSKFYDAWKSGRLVIQFQIIDTNTWSRISSIHTHTNAACEKELNLKNIMPNDMDSYDGFIPTRGAVKDSFAELIVGSKGKAKDDLEAFLDSSSEEKEETKKDEIDF
tara:strand:- start:36 stop:518 length:483 start_codon:yes stop_codon:yes gene_type:complete